MKRKEEDLSREVSDVPSQNKPIHTQLMYYHLASTYMLEIIYSPDTISRDDNWAEFWGCMVNTDMNTDVSFVVPLLMQIWPKQFLRKCS